jgi:hypothetical protein
MVEMKTGYKILIGKQLRDLEMGQRVLLKWILKQ